MHDQPTTNENLGEYAPCDDDQIQAAGDSGLEAGRRFCNPFHRSRCSHIHFSDDSGGIISTDDRRNPFVELKTLVRILGAGPESCTFLDREMSYRGPSREIG
jgi:hypothetical protein